MTQLEAPIVAVTVFPDRARITRRGQVTLTEGEHRVSVGPLPMGLLHDSVRVAGSGAATVLGVDVTTRRRPESSDADVSDVEDRLRQIETEIAERDDADEIAAARERFLARMATRAANAFAASAAPGSDGGLRGSRRGEAPTGAADLTQGSGASPASASGDAIAAAAGFADGIDAEIARIRHDKRTRAREREYLQREREAAQRRLDDLRGNRLPDELVAVLNLEVAQDGEIDMEVSYVTLGASWHSSYDLRLAGEAVSLTWYGLVSQHTGENWPECQLKLSTARPSGALDVPELDPWYVDRVRPPRPMEYTLAAASMPMPASAARPMMAKSRGMAFGRADAPEAQPMVEESYAVVEQGQTASTYTPTRPVAVPSDGTDHRTVVAQIDLEAKLDHVTAPVRAEEAILRATVRNTSVHTFPDAIASLFHEGDYVGSSHVEAWAPDEERELALGVDDRVRVERELVKRSATKATLGSARRVDAEYEITVANHSPRAINLTVLDQLPVSRDGQITVKETSARPEPAERSDLGVVTWKTEVEMGARAKFRLGFRVETAKGVELAGWRD